MQYSTIDLSSSWKIQMSQEMADIQVHISL